MAVPLLVSCTWLHNERPADVLVLDVSWSSAKNMEEEYKKGHIPGSMHLNVMNGEHTDLFPRNLPTAKQFQESVRRVGVNNSSHVVLYSDSDFCGYFMSGRAWWTFKYFGANKVSILDGGWQKWIKEGFASTTNIPNTKTGDFTVQVMEHLKHQYDGMAEDVNSQRRQVCDSRPTAKHDAGHIATAKSLPLSKLLNEETTTLRPAEEIRQEFANAGIDITKPLSTYCNSGMSSCSLIFAAHLCGNTDAVLYHGGFTEWSKKADNTHIQKRC